MSITWKQMQSLSYGTVLYHCIHRNADGTPQRWRLAGAPKTWKREARRTRLSLRHGIQKTTEWIDCDKYGAGTTSWDMRAMEQLCLCEEEALAGPLDFEVKAYVPFVQDPAVSGWWGIYRISTGELLAAVPYRYTDSSADVPCHNAMQQANALLLSMASTDR